MLLDRCIPSVRAQTYAPIEHIVVIDGPDPDLAAELAALDPPVTWDTLPDHQGPQWGTRARLRGLELATGTIICYLDDDDAYRPGHVATLVKALEGDPGAGFAYSLMASHDGEAEHIIGSSPPCCGTIGTPMIAHRRSVLDLGSWGPPGPVEDWQMVARWIANGARYVHVEEVTVDVWPSALR
jgi:glycosyltransferase involved in cell wall biosynthesis